jgi:hypothetical protein
MARVARRGQCSGMTPKRCGDSGGPDVLSR